jgi:hypothetical protein
VCVIQLLKVIHVELGQRNSIGLSDGLFQGSIESQAAAQSSQLINVIHMPSLFC